MQPPAMIAEVPTAIARAPRAIALAASTPSLMPPISTIDISSPPLTSASASFASWIADRVGMPTYSSTS